MPTPRKLKQTQKLIDILQKEQRFVSVRRYDIRPVEESRSNEKRNPDEKSNGFQ